MKCSCGWDNWIWYIEYQDFKCSICGKSWEDNKK
jgi:hypothetical protein